MPDAGIELKRVVDLVTQSEVDSGVYTLIDSTTGAVKKYPLGSFIASVAPIFDSTAAYTAGSYCNYNGQIYKFTADHAAGSWTGSDATAVNVGGELSNLKADNTDLDNRVTALEQGGGSGLTSDIKQALLQLAAKVAYVDDDGQDYYDDLHDAFYTLVSISAVYTQSGTVYDTDSLDSLKTDLVVTAHYDDQSTETVTAYTLSGTLAEGTSTVTVSYKGKTTTFTVVVTASSSYTYYDYVTMTYNAGDTVPSNCGILTDIAMSSDYTLETSVYYGNTSVSSPQNIMGTRNGQGGTKEFGLFCMTSNGKLGYWYGGTDTSNTFNPMVSEQVNTIKVQPVGVSQDYPTYATINVNGTDYNTGSTTTGATWHSWLGIFKYGISASSTSTSTTDKFSGFQIGEIVIKDSSNNTLHDLKPAYDGTYYGFVDTISGTFYYNATYADKYTCGNWS